MVPISSRKPSFPFPVVCLLTHLVLRCINEENCVLLDLEFVQNSCSLSLETCGWGVPGIDLCCAALWWILQTYKA